MYKRNEDQHEWAVAQMTEAKTPQVIQTAVGRLLEVWWTMNHTDETRLSTLDIFTELALNHSIIPQQPNELWSPLKPGNVVIRDRIRVKRSHYGGEVGRMHNGRIGVVVAIRGGDVIVRYEDEKEPAFDGVHHSPFALEKRVR